MDTSVAVVLLANSHPEHGTVMEWARGRDLVLSGHAAIETYSVLTRLPGEARVSPEDAITLMQHNFEQVIALSAPATSLAHEALAAAGVSGGAAYDGLVALACREHELPLATRDGRAKATYDRLGVQVEIVSSR